MATLPDRGEWVGFSMIGIATEIPLFQGALLPGLLPPARLSSWKDGPRGKPAEIRTSPQVNSRGRLGRPEVRESAVSGRGSVFLVRASWAQ